MKKVTIIGLISFILSFPLNNVVNSQELSQIEGKLIYPSDYLPAMLVCAVNLNSRQRFCIKTEEKDSKFVMKIPYGKYIFSAENIEDSTRKAWMTNFNIECGQPCANNPIQVLTINVNNSVISGICPCDWYTEKNQLIYPSN
jgi:hypothetical protein